MGDTGRATPATGDRSASAPVAAAAGARLRWTLGNVEFDERRLELRREGELIAVEPKPIELLQLLLRRLGEVVTREEILTELWAGRVLTDGVINNCVAKLRAALGDNDQRLLRTVPRFGYRLVAEVQCEPMAAELAPAPAAALAVGQPVVTRPGWMLTRLLGDGGHGEVWLGTDGKQDRVFKFAKSGEDLGAIKRELTLHRVLHDSLGDSGHFVPLLGHNLEQTPYFVEMPWFPQGNLSEWLDARGGVARVPLATRVELIAQCAEAVAMAHSVGVLHKDLKPTNVLVESGEDSSPRARLCDFGSGRMLDADVFLLLAYTRRGFTRADDATDTTPMYLAPEVVAGQPPTTGADIYALGVMLYQFCAENLRRPLAPGWEADVADPLLREDIALASAGNPRRRLGDAGQLATRLRSLPTRREALAAQRRKLDEADALRKRIDTWRAQRGLVMTLVATIILGLGIALWYGFIARSPCDEIPKVTLK